MKHKTRTKALSWLLSLALALSLVPGMGLTAQATPAETLLTTITPTSTTTYSETTSGVASVACTGVADYDATYGWCFSPQHDGSVSVTAQNGYTITKCIFKSSGVTIEDDKAEFTVTYTSGEFFKLSADTSNGTKTINNNAIKSIEVYGYLSHTHSFTYSATGDTITATCSADGCPLDDGNGKHTATLTIKPPANFVYSGNAKEATVEGTIPDVTTPDIMYEGRNGTTYGKSTAAPTAIGDYTASVTLEGQTASVTFEIKDNTYTITIPATLTVANAGWNATAGITASGEIAEDKKLTVTATSANEWKLKDDENTVEYHLATEAGGEAATVWEFSVDELAEQGGTNKTMGAVVEEFLNKPAGDYTDTVTFTAEIESKGPKTYTSLTDGVVLHVGDIVAPTNTYNFSSFSVSFIPEKTYTLLRADITIQGHSTAVTEKDDGVYYVFKRQDPQGGNVRYMADPKPSGGFNGLVFEVTGTSDGLVVTQSGSNWNIAVHEP